MTVSTVSSAGVERGYCQVGDAAQVCGCCERTTVLALKWATSKLALGLWCSSGKFPDIRRLNLIIRPRV